MSQYLLTILVTAAITFALTWAVWKLSLRYKLYPGIRERDVHTTPTPRLGGVAIFLGIFVEAVKFLLWIGVIILIIGVIAALMRFIRRQV